MITFWPRIIAGKVCGDSTSLSRRIRGVSEPYRCLYTADNPGADSFPSTLA